MCNCTDDNSINFAVFLSLNPILFSFQSYSEGFQFSMKPCKLKIGFLLPLCDEIEEEETANYKQKLATINKAEILPKL